MVKMLVRRLVKEGVLVVFDGGKKYGIQGTKEMKNSKNYINS